MKKVTYPSGKTYEYDENAPCIICGLPVVEASMGGTVICPWCDCGNYRNGTKFTLEEEVNHDLIKKRAREKLDRPANNDTMGVKDGG